MKVTKEAQAHALTLYTPDTRGVVVSRFGKGNLKIGQNVFTYSRLPGHWTKEALGTNYVEQSSLHGTCPGASEECQKICYAARPVTENGPVYEMWAKNSITEDVPMELPPGCRLLRIHISGDFTTVGYINGWFALLAGRLDVQVWAYTRSWRVKSLRPALERLRSLPNVQVFASVDSSTPTSELETLAGWRLAWIDGDYRGERYQEGREDDGRNRLTMFGTRSYLCPEETGHKADCESCRYCFDGRKGDVTFLKH